MSEATIFAKALETPNAEERAAYLDQACAGDAALRGRVEKLLHAHDQAADFLERPAVEQMTLDGRIDFLEPSDRPDSLGRFAEHEVLEIVCRSPLGAVVLKAFDDKLHRVVAIKLLASESTARGAAGRRFLREARAAAAVRDDHVVAVHAVGDQPLPYLVMEYVAGQSLQQKLEQTGPLELNQILRIGSQAARGLAAIHAQGLVHRDIKPANILLENGIERVKITDFGLARAVDDATTSQPGVVAGTPVYMSPEQAQGEPIDPRSDLFSLGSVLYALCTGRSPFRAADTLAVLRRVIDDTPTPIGTINPGIPSWLSDLIGRLHAKKPADRPQSAMEVADVLARHLVAQQGSVGASIPTPPVRQRTPLRSRRWTLAAIALFAVAGLAMAEVTGVSHLTGTVIRVFSPDGTLIIEADDPNISVAIDGKEVVINGAGAREIRLRPGTHRIQPAQAGVVVDTPMIVVERNGRTIVRVRREPSVAPAPAAGKVATPPAVSGTVSAAEVAKTFRENVALATSRYVDRRVVVTGQMLKIGGGQKLWSKDSWVHRYQLELDASEGGDGCYLAFQFNVPLDAHSPLVKLAPSQFVTVEGECSGWLPQQSQPDKRRCIMFWECKVLPPEPQKTDRTTAVGGVGAVPESSARAIAEWAIAVGGSVQIKQSSGAAAWFQDEKGKLPDTFDSVTEIGLSGCKQVRDADLAKLATLHDLTLVRLEFSPITDKGLAHVVQLRGLTQLYLRHSAIGDGALPLLAKLPDLDVLDISATKISEAGLKHLDELSKVTYLALHDLPVTDDTMRRLAELTCLTTLDLAGTKITDAGVRELAKLDRLQILRLSKTALTDASLEPLSRLKILAALDLAGTKIQGTGLTHLMKLDRLKDLSLADTPLTDAALEHLAKMTSLRRLDLGRTMATPSGVAKLRRALPQCQVTVD